MIHYEWNLLNALHSGVQTSTWRNWSDCARSAILVVIKLRDRKRWSIYSNAYTKCTVPAPLCQHRDWSVFPHCVVGLTIVKKNVNHTASGPSHSSEYDNGCGKYYSSCEWNYLPYLNNKSQCQYSIVALTSKSGSMSISVRHTHKKHYTREKHRSIWVLGLTAPN